MLVVAEVEKRMEAHPIHYYQLLMVVLAAVAVELKEANHLHLPFLTQH